MISVEEMKRVAGEYAVRFIQPGTVTGIGTGTTVFYFIHALAKKVKEGFDTTAVVTSRQSGDLARQLGITVRDLNEVDTIDITIDGADEIDKQLQLIKGGGGALLWEKMVAAASRKLIVIADDHKLVDQLGDFPLPVEVIPYGWKQTQKHISNLGYHKIILREKDSEPFTTDQGNYILDCYCEKIENATLLSQQLNAIPGVVENGLFIDMAAAVIIGKEDGTVKMITREQPGI